MKYIHQNMIDYRYKGSVTNMSKVKEYYLEEEYTPIQEIEMLQKENKKRINNMKITMYELLGLVKDGKAPKKIKYINSIWEYDKEKKDYFNDDLWLIYSMNSIGLTEREVEILEEEKKIPEKLKILNANDHSKEVYYENYSKEEISLDIETLQTWVNEIIDYLDYFKSKGE